jgi:hypothetical protein
MTAYSDYTKTASWDSVLTNSFSNLLTNPGPTTTPSPEQSKSILRLLEEGGVSQIAELESLVSPFAFSSLVVAYATARYAYGVGLLEEDGAIVSSVLNPTGPPATAQTTATAISTSTDGSGGNSVSSVSSHGNAVPTRGSGVVANAVAIAVGLTGVVLL